MPNTIEKNIIKDNEPTKKIYKITFPSGKVYVGQTSTSLSLRRTRHVNSAFNVNSDSYHTKVSRAIRKYGSDNLEWDIVDVCFSRQELDEKERFYIKALDSIRSGYNISEGGTGGDCLKNASESVRKHHREKARMNTQKWWNEASSEQRQKRCVSLSQGVFCAQNRTRSKEEDLQRSETMKRWWVDNPKEKKERSKKMMGNTCSQGKLKGSKNGRAKLDEAAVKKIRNLYKTEKVTQKQLADMFGVSQSQIGYIVNFRGWK